MKEQSASGILGTSIEKIKDLVDVSTIIGDPIKISETLQIIPVSKVTYGFASGGTDFPSKSNAELFGGGGGAGITITPIAFIVVNNGEVSIKHISTEEGSIERTIGMIPDVVNGVTDVVNKFVDGKGWVAAGDLEVGDILYTADGDEVEVTDIELEKLAEPITVYNLEVEDFHTYFVGEYGVLVHNYEVAGKGHTGRQEP